MNTLLKKLEWSSYRQGPGSGIMSSGGDGPMVQCCPCCKGINPADKNADDFIQEVIGHRKDCELNESINSDDDQIIKELRKIRESIKE